jgi:hypothetical protein
MGMQVLEKEVVQWFCSQVEGGVVAAAAAVDMKE